MIGGDLAVDEMEIALLGEFYEVSQSHLGGLGFVMEHGFPEKSCAQGDPIESSNELAIPIALEGMCKAFCMKICVRLDHVGSDPCAGLVFSWHSGAGSDDLLECGVDSDFEGFLLEGGSQASGDFEFVGKKQETRIRGKPVPQGRISPGFPWENTVGVGEKQTLGS